MSSTSTDASRTRFIAAPSMASGVAIESDQLNDLVQRHLAFRAFVDLICGASAARDRTQLAPREMSRSHQPCHSPLPWNSMTVVLVGHPPRGKGALCSLSAPLEGGETPSVCKAGAREENRTPDLLITR